MAFDSLVSISPTGTGVDFPTSGTATTSDKPPPAPKAAKAPAPTPEPEKTAAAPKADKTQTAMQGLGELQQQYAERMPERPKPPQVPERPKTIKDDIQLWGALAIAFSALASRRTRTPMTTALNAAAAAMNGMREGNKEAADQAYKEWQENTKIAFQMADYEQRAYEDALHDREHVDAVHFQALTASLGDAETWNAYKSKLQETGSQDEAMKAAADLQKTRREAKEKAEKAALPILEAHEVSDQLDKLHKDPEWKAKDRVGQMEADAEVFQKFSPKAFSSQFATGNEDRIQQLMEEPSVAADANAVADYQIKRPTGWLARGDRWQAVQRVLERDHPEYSDTNYNAVSKIKTDLATGTQMSALTTLMGHLQTLDKLAKSLPNDADSQTVNRAMIAAAREFGYPDVTNYETAAHAVGEEFNKVLLGTGIGSQEDRDAAAKPVVASQTKEQLQGSINTMKELVKSRVIAKINQFSLFVKPERFFPKEVLQFYGVKPSGQSTLSDMPAGPKEGGKTAITPDNAKSQGYTHMRMSGGKTFYSKSDGGPWIDPATGDTYDNSGKRIGQ